jgi:hypothetical protein
MSLAGIEPEWGKTPLNTNHSGYFGIKLGETHQTFPLISRMVPEVN